MIIIWRTQGRARGQVYTPYMQGAYQASVGASGATVDPLIRGRSRKKRKPLYVVRFNDAPIGVESPEEMVALARISDELPKITLSKKVDYGPMIDELKAAIRQIEAERIEREDDEVIIFLLH